METAENVCIGNSLSRLIGLTSRHILRALPQVCGGGFEFPARMLLVIIACSRRIENRIQELCRRMKKMTRNQWRIEIAEHALEFLALHELVREACIRLYQLSGQVTAPVALLEIAMGWLNGAEWQLTCLFNGDLDGWIRDPERSRLEQIQRALNANEPDVDDYLDWLLCKLTLRRTLEYRYALAYVIWRGNWRKEKFSGWVSKYIRLATTAVAMGSNDSKWLGRLPLSTAGEPEATTEPEIVDSQLRDKIEILLPDPIPELSADENAVLQARRAGLSLTAIPAFLSKTTGEPWSKQRVKNANEKLLRKRVLFQPFVSRDQICPKTGVCREQLPSGRRVWSHEAPDPYLLAVIREGLPLPGKKKHIS
jgi:hypothetical protein